MLIKFLHHVVVGDDAICSFPGHSSCLLLPSHPFKYLPSTHGDLPTILHATWPRAKLSNFDGWPLENISCKGFVKWFPSLWKGLSAQLVPVHCSYWPEQGTNLHSGTSSTISFQNSRMLCIYTQQLTNLHILTLRWMQLVPLKFWYHHPQPHSVTTQRLNYCQNYCFVRQKSRTLFIIK